MMQRIADGIWRWELRHPDWHPSTEFGATVACYVVHEGENTVLVDPLFEDTADIDPLIQGEVVVAVTIPYHVRNAADAVNRWGGTIIGHPDVQRRLPEGTPFHGDGDLPLGLTMHKVTRLKERPLELPQTRSLCFGDRVVGVEGGLRVWLQNPITDKRREWFRKTGAPAMTHLLDVSFDRVLVTHGDPGAPRWPGGPPQRIGRRPLVSPPDMSDHVYKSVEITGSSEAGVQEAIDGALTKAAKSLRNIDWFEVVGVRGGVTGEKTYYQVTLKIGFRLED